MGRDTNVVSVDNSPERLALDRTFRTQPAIVAEGAGHQFKLDLNR